MPYKAFLWAAYYPEEKHIIGNSKKVQEGTEEKLKNFCVQV